MNQFTLLPCFIALVLSLTLSIQSVAQEAQDSPQTEQQTPEPGSSETTKSNEEAGENPSGESSTKTSEKPIEIAPPTPLVDQFESDIKRSVDNNFISPLLAGPDDFLTVTQPDMHSSDKGVAILLPDWGQAAINPKAINFLRQTLPMEGWTTIAIQPLIAPIGYPSQNSKAEKAKEEDSKLLETYQEKLVPMLTSVMEKAADYPGIFIVIAQGNNAAQLLKIYQQEDVTKPNAVILLSAHMLTESDNKELSSLIANSEIPVLDLWLKKDTRWVSNFAKHRAMFAQKELKTFYRQRQLTNFNAGYYPEEALAKEIKGWLTTIGW